MLVLLIILKVAWAKSEEPACKQDIYGLDCKRWSTSGCKVRFLLDMGEVKVNVVLNGAVKSVISIYEFLTD